MSVESAAKRELFTEEQMAVMKRNAEILNDTGQGDHMVVTLGMKSPDSSQAE